MTRTTVRPLHSFAAIALASAALAACSGERQAPANAIEDLAPNSAAAPADPTAPATDGHIGDKPAPLPAATADAEPDAEPEPAPEPTATPSPSASASPGDDTAAAIPPRFRGRWGLVSADCDPRRDDNKGLMTVAARQLRFYESRAVPAKIERAGPDALAVTLAFSGEGQTWSEIARLTLRQNGRVLVRTGAEGGPLRYTRCRAPQGPGRR